MLKNKKLLMKIFKALFLIAVAYFLVSYFVKNAADIKELDFKISFLSFGLSMVFYFAYKLSLACLWHYITVLNNCSISIKKAVRVYLYSILGKYIPGKVFMLAARLPAYSRENVPARKPTVCFFIENVCTLLGAAFLFLISLAFFPNDILNKYMWFVVIFIVAFFVCINPKIINFFLARLGKLIKKDDITIPMNYIQMVKVVLLFVANWFIVGIGFYLLINSIYQIPVSQMLYVGGIFGLSAIIGIISLFAPSGIGVREGIIVAGLVLIMPKEYAVIISVVSRLWVTVAELILIFIAFVIEKCSAYISKRR